MQLRENFDFGEFRKNRKPSARVPELRQPPAPVHTPGNDLMTQFGNRFDSVLTGLPIAEHEESVDFEQDQHSIHALRTTLNAELDCSVDFLDYVEGRIKSAIVQRSGVLRSMLYFRQLATLRDMHQRQRELSKELGVLRQKIDDAISAFATVGGSPLTVNDIRRQFAAFRGMKVEKELQAFEKQFYSAE